MNYHLIFAPVFKRFHPGRLFLFLSLLAVSQGCSVHSRYSLLSYEPVSYQQEVLPYDYHQVWSAVIATLADFPILNADRENGLVTTDFVSDVSYYNLYFDGRNPKQVSKFGFFSYKLPGHDDTAIVVYVEPESPAARLLRPGDVISNYNQHEMANSTGFDFAVTRGAEYTSILIQKELFYSRFASYMAINSRMRFNIRLSEVGRQQTALKIGITEEQLQAGFNPEERVLALGSFVPIPSDGYKQQLLANLIRHELLRQVN